MIMRLVEYVFNEFRLIEQATERFWDAHVGNQDVNIIDRAEPSECLPTKFFGNSNNDILSSVSQYQTFELHFGLLWR